MVTIITVETTGDETLYALGSEWKLGVFDDLIDALPYFYYVASGHDTDGTLWNMGYYLVGDSKILRVYDPYTHKAYRIGEYLYNGDGAVVDDLLFWIFLAVIIGIVVFLITRGR